MINMENYEGYLYLYQEGELDIQTRAEVERFLLEHPDIREEMESYYDPSFVVTAEEPAKKSRTVSLWRWTAAACAVLALGYGVWTMLPTPSNPEDQPLVAQQRVTPRSHRVDTTPLVPSPTAQTHSLESRTAQKAYPGHSSATTVSDSYNRQASDTATSRQPLAGTAERPDVPTEYINWQLAEETILTDCLAEEYTVVDNLAAVEPEGGRRREGSLLAVVVDRTATRQQAFVGILKEEVFSIFSTSDTLRAI